MQELNLLEDPTLSAEDEAKEAKKRTKRAEREVAKIKKDAEKNFIERKLMVSEILTNWGIEATPENIYKNMGMNPTAIAEQMKQDALIAESLTA